MEKADKTDKTDKTVKMDIEDKHKLLNTPGLKLVGKLYEPMMTMLQKCINNVVPLISENQSGHVNHNAENFLGAHRENFLGAHPVSLTRENFSEKLKTGAQFLTCEKTDGVRYLLFVTNFGDTILNGRKKEFHLVNIPMPPPMIDEKAKENRVQYLFDGELILDKVDGEYFWRYLIFDCIIYNFDSVFSHTYIERLRYALSYVNTIELSKKFLGKANILPQLNPQTKSLPEITLYVKDFYVASAKNPDLTTNPEFFIKNMAPKLPHKNDGIIFTQNEAAYQKGTNKTILKWKSPDQNTIDFLLVNNYSLVSRFGKTIVDLYVTKQKNYKTRESSFVLFDFMIVDEKIFDNIGKVIGINQEKDWFRYKDASSERIFYIAECKYNREFSNDVLTELVGRYSSDPKFIDELLSRTALHDNALDHPSKNLKINLQAKKKSGKGNWEITKDREDKIFPNTCETAESVHASIEENLTIEDLRDQLFPPRGQNHVDPGPEKRVKKA